MYEIRINLNNSASLGPLASPMPPAPAALPGGIGAVPRIYLIVNTTTNTRYAGISTNLQARFNGRMAVVNEFGMAAPTMAPIWAWWGTMETRRFPPSAVFPSAFPTLTAGFALGNCYALPGGGLAPCPAAVPALLPGPPSPQQAALDAVLLPIRSAVGAFQAWTAIPMPKTVFAFNPAFGLAVGFAPPPGVALAAVAQPTAGAAAQAAALAAGAPGPIAAAAAVAVATCAAGGAPPPSDTATVVQSYYGGPPVPAAPAATLLAVRNPVAGPPTTLNVAIAPGIAAINLEQAFIRFVLNHLGAGGFVANGALIGPLGWPGSPEPICITWNSAGGGGLPPWNVSLMWWGGAL